MNKKEVTKRLIRGESCDTCRWKLSDKCMYVEDSSPNTTQCDPKDLPKNNTCEKWARKFDFQENVAEDLKKKIDDLAIKVTSQSHRRPIRKKQYKSIFNY